MNGPGFAATRLRRVSARTSGSPLANALGSEDEDHELPLLLPGLATGRGPHRGSVNSDDERLQHFE
jgi:hypothetical protein